MDPAPRPAPDHPREIAGYRILSRIAEGGMGIVYEALQESPRRRIALKVLKSALGSTDARQRFEYECGFLGRLRHPCIAQIYQASSFEAPDGQRVPLFAMELVLEGQPITSYARDRELGERERLELFVKVIDGVHHAHQRGVVHRDLKPQNILVDGAGQPKVIDFGVAREIEPSEGATSVQTRTGQVLGTPQYMSPEQCAGRPSEIDLRTDVYSLGVVLFELLAGALPYDFGDRSLFDFARVIREERPARLSSTGGGRRSDLDTIVGMALEKDPERRYASVAALADDIRRYLRCEPIAARPPSAMYQLRMFARRNTATVVGLVAVVVVSMLAAVLGTSMALRLSDLADRERALRSQGLVGAAKLAARTVAIEVELRWRILESEAVRGELRTLLAALNEAPASAGSPERGALQAWLQDRFASHSAASRAVSWFVTGDDGVMHARMPFSAEAAGSSFAFRDYFHGMGRDLAPDEVDGVRPLEHAHRSIAFRSQVTNNLMVAFSVPIWSDGVGEGSGQVLGVIGMTVELGRFGVLQLGLGDDQIAVLVDVREDASGRRGLVAHHAELARLRAEQGRRPPSAAVLPSYYVSAGMVERFEALGVAQLARDRGMQAVSWEEQVLQRQQLLPGVLDMDWRDPVGGGYAGRWLAAYEPVLIEGRSESIRDTGWVVVVQERADRNPDPAR